jgi:hypothetical protein
VLRRNWAFRLASTRVVDQDSVVVEVDLEADQDSGTVVVVGTFIRSSTNFTGISATTTITTTVIMVMEIIILALALDLDTMIMA